VIKEEEIIRRFAQDLTGWAQSHSWTKWKNPTVTWMTKE
jgi:hypothetical protein